MKSVGFVLAIAVLTVFGVFVNYLLHNLSMADLQWSRSIYLFSGVESIAFAAAGFLFGREVHRQAAQDADERAETAMKDAEKGRYLAGQVKGFFATRGEAAVENDLVREANRLFPI